MEVYERCRIDIVAGLAVHHHGIAPAEVRAALELLRIPTDRWPDLSDDVYYMGQRASDAINERNRSQRGDGK